MSKRTNTPNQNPLFTALARNDRKALLLALKRVREINPRGLHGWTPLMEAAHLGRTGLVKLLLAWGADVNLDSTRGVTALHLAAGTGQVAVVRLLLTHDADPTRVDTNGWTAIERGASRSPAMIAALLTHPPGPVACEKALLRAVFFGSRPVVELLLTHCRRQGLPAWGGGQVLCKAAECGHRSLMRWLLRQAPPAQARWDALVAAVNAGHRALAENLWQGLPRTSPVVIAARQQLAWAALVGATDAMEVLLQAGADPQEADSAGRMPLHWAAGGKSWPVVRQLLAAGADVEIPDRDGWRPMHWAARSGSLSVVTGLLAAGAEVTALTMDQSQKTPLHLACMRSSPAVARRLILAGAEVNRQADGQSPLYVAVCCRSPRVVALLIDQGAEVNGLQGQMRNSPLHEAAEWGFLSIARQLLAAGADLNAFNGWGQTPLDLATRYGWRRLVVLLKAAGARSQDALRDG